MNRSMISAGSFCRTCLSEGRKMFPFPLNYEKLPFSTFYKDLKFTSKDKICWECKSFMLKMAAFRFKALMAQGNLAVLQKKPWTELQSLSKLAISKGIYLEIIEPPEPDPLNLDIKVKSEIEPDENNYIRDEHDYIGDVKSEMGDVNDEIGKGSNEEIIFQVYHHRTCVPESNKFKVNLDVANHIGNIFQVFENNTFVAPGCSKRQITADVANYSGNIGNSTLMSLLSRKSTRLSFTPLANETTSKNVASENKTIIDIVKLPQNPTYTPETPNSQTVTKIFTEERLTEEEMRRWRESKGENEFYVNSIPVFRCEKCLEPFVTRRSFLGHNTLHTEMYGELPCDICELRFNTESTRATHRENHYRLLKCNYCAHKWDNPNSMRRHCYIEHRFPATEWNCDLCPRQLQSYHRYLNHVKAHGFEPCADCGRRVNILRMRTHMLTHAGSAKKFECAECGSRFRTKELVRGHILRMHNTKEEGRSYCVDCNMHFRNMTSYKTHMKFATKHVTSELLRYKCEECARAFTSKVLLRRHVESRHSDQRNYPCQVCSARFRSSTARTRHRRVTHEGYVASRDYMCDHCGKAFYSKRQLSTHINTHTGARPFVCKLCGADFGQQSALYLHGRYKHKIQKVKKNDGIKVEDNIGS